MAAPSQNPLTTHQIQAKLEENFDLLTKLTSVTQQLQKQAQQNPEVKPDPQTKAMIDQWSSTLHENLMQLAGQADANQPQAAPAAAAASATSAVGAPGAAAR